MTAGATPLDQVAAACLNAGITGEQSIVVARDILMNLASIGFDPEAERVRAEKAEAEVAVLREKLEAMESAHYDALRIEMQVRDQRDEARARADAHAESTALLEMLATPQYQGAPVAANLGTVLATVGKAREVDPAPEPEATDG